MDRRSKFTFRHQHNVSYRISTECGKCFWTQHNISYRISTVLEKFLEYIEKGIDDVV